MTPTLSPDLYTLLDAAVPWVSLAEWSVIALTTLLICWSAKPTLAYWPTIRLIASAMSFQGIYAGRVQMLRIQGSLDDVAIFQSAPWSLIVPTVGCGCAAWALVLVLRQNWLGRRGRITLSGQAKRATPEELERDVIRLDRVRRRVVAEAAVHAQIDREAHAG